LSNADFIGILPH